VLIEFHALHYLPYSNVNREESGAPKTLMLGDALRGRWSSQSMKRRIREGLGEEDRPGAGIGRRTRMLPEDAIADLLAAGLDGGDAAVIRRKVEYVFAALKMPTETTKGDEGDPSAPVTTRTKEALLVPANARDLVYAALSEHWAGLPAEAAEEASKTKGRKGRAPKKAVAAAEETTPAEEGAAEAAAGPAGRARIEPALAARLKDILTDGALLDVALFGRFLASMPGAIVDGAVYAADAFTTHPITFEFDFWTAVEEPDRARGNGGARGAALLGTNAFLNGVFYRYAIVDLDALRQNLPDAPAAEVQAVLAGFAREFLNLRPRGMAHPKAPFTQTSLALSVVTDGIPVNLADAFVQPVPPEAPEGLIVASAQRLAEFWNHKADAYREPVTGGLRHRAAYLWAGSPDVAGVEFAHTEAVDNLAWVERTVAAALGTGTASGGATSGEVAGNGVGSLAGMA
jgi:CRISPR system Cascade subunit CasC